MAYISDRNWSHGKKCLPVEVIFESDAALMAKISTRYCFKQRVQTVRNC